MRELLNIGYVGVGVTDVEAWERFLVEFIGLMPGERISDGSLVYRMDEYQHRITVEQNSLDDMLYVGWELRNQVELEEYVAQLENRGVMVERASDELAEKRRVARLYTTEDPNGFTHEFYYGALLAPVHEPFRSPIISGNFVTGNLGFGHITSMAFDYQESFDYYQNTLGLRLSDYMTEEIAPGAVVQAAFFHTAGGRHHSLGLGVLKDIPKPQDGKRIDHLMVEVDNIDDVGLAYERAKALGITVTKNLGRHPNDQMFSIYVKTPSGFDFEFGTGGLVIEGDDWTVVEFDRLSSWGHNKES